MKLSAIGAALLVIAALPAASKGASQAPESGVPKQLNVLLHGLFAIVISDDGAEILMPQVDDHVYKAGTWGKEMRLKEGAVYDLTGVTGTNAPALDKSHLMLLQGYRTIHRDPSKLFATIRVPLPSEIHPLRLVTPAAANPLLGGTSASQIRASQFPLVIAFVYRNPAFGQLALGTHPWKPEISGDVVNLHVWAEPDAPLEQNMAHSTEAFQHLVQLFGGLQLYINATNNDTVPLDRNTHITGVQPWEETAMVERNLLLYPRPSPTRGAHLTNCVGLVVNNSSQ